MKKMLGGLTALLFISALLLNVSFDAKGNFRLLGIANAKSVPYKGPSVWYCYKDHKIYAYGTVCTDEGTLDCVPVACPDPTE
jgi:hypothetical protein